MKNNTIDNYRKTVQELLPEINANIEKYRKGNFKIKVLREDGTPVAATVKAEQKKHAFDFGTNVLMLGHMGEKEQEYRCDNQSVQSHYNNILLERYGTPAR